MEPASPTARRRSRARRAAAVIASALTAALAVAGCSSSRDEAGSAIAPSDGVALGMYYGDRPQDETDAALGVVPAIHLTYVPWEADWSSDPVLAQDAARGQTSLVNWEPFGVHFQDIVDGEHDALIAARAEGAAQLDRPILLDFAAEMNEEEGWGGHDPDLYVSAWRHVHDIVEEHAADKVEWVWAPNNTDSEGAPAAVEYYPGEDYVDWTGIDGYNWGTSEPGFAWQSFEEVFGDVYDVLTELGKPIIIGETASGEVGGSKAEWIRAVVPTLESRFPEIRALVWFDVEKERDWRIRSSNDAFAAFRDLAHDPGVVTARTLD